MDIKKKILFHFLFIVVIITGSSYVILNRSTKTYIKSIKGIQTHVVSSTPTPTFSPSPTLTPTPTNQLLSTKTQPSRIKQYGAWYWQPELNRAQIWIGTNSAGRDIWAEHFPAPTPTPTPKPTNQQPSTQGNNSGSTGESETKVKTSNTLQFVSTGQVYIQSCSNDGTNPIVPKCP